MRPGPPGASAGAELNGIGKILVPNIAGSRLRWGKWERHVPTAAVSRRWLGWGPNDYLASPYAVMQGRDIARSSGGDVSLGVYLTGLKRGASTQKKVTILRTP